MRALLTSVVVTTALWGATVESRADSDPSQGEYEQAIGFYTSGQLVNAVGFDRDGDGFIKIFQPRDRGWATHDLRYVLSVAARAIRQYYPTGERLQIGDTSARAGGFISGHRSHQHGLDADVVYYRVDRREQRADDWGSRGFEESFVRGDRLSGNFDVERNWAFVQSLVSTGRINRIFVDPVIKRELCAHAFRTGAYSETSEALRRLRPLSNHDDHYHIRLTCPKMSPGCKEQEPPPAGSGCLSILSRG